MARLGSARVDAEERVAEMREGGQGGAGGWQREDETYTVSQWAMFESNSSGTRNSQARTTVHKTNQAWAARVIGQISKLYGYSCIGAGINVTLIMGLSSLPFTQWKVDGTTGSSRGLTNATAFSSATALVERPEPNFWIWRGAFFGAVLPLIFSARITAGVAAHGAFPLENSLGWKHCRVCFVSMLLLTCLAVGITYLLPAALGTPIEYYFLDTMPILLAFTLCVVVTAMIMQYFDAREREGISAPAGQAGERAVRGDSEVGFLQNFLNLLNVGAIGTVTLSCKLMFIYQEVWDYENTGSNYSCLTAAQTRSSSSPFTGLQQQRTGLGSSSSA